MTIDNDANEILNKTIAVSIQFGSIGQSRKVSMTGVEIDADKGRLSLSAKILQGGRCNSQSFHRDQIVTS